MPIGCDGQGRAEVAPMLLRACRVWLPPRGNFKFWGLIVLLFKVNIMSRRKTNTGIPGLSFSWKRALGITQAKQKFARETGIPTSRAGVERKIGNMILKALFGKR